MGHWTSTYLKLESLHTTSSWDFFQSGFATLEQDLSSTKDSWSPGAIQLVLDCMVLLVGERLLPGLQAELDHGSSVQSSEIARYEKCLQQYTSILKTFVDRNLDVEGEVAFWSGLKRNN